MEKEECYKLYQKEREFLELLNKNGLYYDENLNDIFYGGTGEESGIRVGSILNSAQPFLLITNLPKRISTRNKRDLERGTSKLRKLAEEFKI